MRRGLRRDTCILAIILSLLMVMAGCGGGGATPPTTTPPAVTIALGTSPTSLTVGQNYQFTATVTNATNTAVTWAISSTACALPCGNSSFGTISTSGLYTAPASVPTPQSVTITATSAADTTKSASASVTITPAVTVVLGTSPASLNVGQTYQFTATVSNATNTAVTWAINSVTCGLPCGNPNFGTISTSGLYTAPATVPAPPGVTITATSVADTTKSASVSVAITSGVVIAITTPTSPQSLAVNGTLGFTASVTGSSNTAVTWTVNGVVNGNATFGTITGSGLSVTYNAPSSVPSPATFSITATSQADQTKSASVSMTITSAGGGSVTVTQTSLPSGTVGVAYTTTTLTATGGTSPYTWSITAGSLPLGLTLSAGGVISGTPLAIETPGFTVQAMDSSGAHLTGTQVFDIVINTSSTVSNAINVPGGASTTGINFSLSSLSTTLGLADVGLCTPGCSASVATITVAKGSTTTVWLLGTGLTNATGSQLATGLTMDVSHVAGSSDVTISSVTALAPSDNGANLQNITFSLTVSASAASGPRNIIVTNAAGEVQAFIGAIKIQ
ncbi:MAG: putative Ig domain-containing protein [Acidobacteriota bacterium]|nr:putative Ig domain-containing protein [Acidobacteriota bacterium]